MIFVVKAMLMVVAFLAMIALPAGYCSWWSKRVGTGERIERPEFKFTRSIVVLVGSLLFYLILSNWVKSGFSKEGFESGTLAALIVGAGMSVLWGPYTLGGMLAYHRYRRQRLRQFARNPDLLISRHDRKRIKDWIARDGEVTVAYRDSAPTEEEYTYIVRSEEELIHLLVFQEKCRRAAQIRGSSGETVAVEQF